MKKINLLFTAILTALLASCYQGESADLIIHNAKIYSCDEAFNVYEAMAIRDGKIIQLGPEREILNGYDCDNIIDAQLRPVYPGFYDGHCHFLGYAQQLGEADLKGSLSFDEVLERLELFNSRNNEEWILGRGWDQTLWEDESMPNNTRLNELFPNQPVLIRRIDGHAALANNKALELAGIDSTTVVSGSLIEKKEGVLTGILLDNAYDLVAKIIPEQTTDRKLELLKEAEYKLFEAGLTSINDAGINSIDRQLFIDWYTNKSLRIKNYSMLFPDSSNLDFAMNNGVYQSGNLHIRSFKIIADGALGSSGACLIHPYSDMPQNHGIMLKDTSELIDIAEFAKEIGYQINTHCIGDSANRTMLNIYARVIQDQPNHRWKIEHAQVLAKEDFDLFTALKVIPSVQPTHCTSDMRWAEKRLGPQRILHAYAYQTLLEKAGTIVLGTDFPVEAIYPLETFYAAITRQNKDGQPIGGFYPDQTLSRADALRGMTIWAAESNFEEDSRGSLEAGKAADFVILTKDIMKVDAKEILTTYVAKTFLDGVMVFDGE